MYCARTISDKMLISRYEWVFWPHAHSASAEASNGTKNINHPNTAAAPTSSSTKPNSLPIGIANRTAIAAALEMIKRRRSCFTLVFFALCTAPREPRHLATESSLHTQWVYIKCLKVKMGALPKTDVDILCCLIVGLGSWAAYCTAQSQGPLTGGETWIGRASKIYSGKPQE